MSVGVGLEITNSVAWGLSPTSPQLKQYECQATPLLVWQNRWLRGESLEVCLKSLPQHKRIKVKRFVGIIIDCEECGSSIAFVSQQWKMGKRFTLPCPVCREEYKVAFTISPVKEETSMPDYVIKGFVNG